MRLLKLIRDNKDRIQLILLCSIAASIPFSISIGNIAIILTVSFNILFFDKENLKYVSYFPAWYLVVFFIITILSSFYSKDTALGLHHLDLTLLMLLFAVIFINSKITQQITHKILISFYISTFVFTFILITIALVRLFENEAISDIIFHRFTALYDQHPVHYSMYLTFALFYAFYIAPNNIRKVLKSKWLFILSIVIILTGLILCASKAVLGFSLFAMSTFYLFKKSSIRKKLIIIAFGMLISVLLYNIPFVKSRFTDGLRFNESIALFHPTNNFNYKKKFTYNEKTNISDLELRFILAKVSIYHVVKDGQYIFGYGQGDTGHYLNYYLFTYNLGPNWYENINVHNQYIHIFLMYGVIVLLFFISYLIYSFKKAILQRDALHFYFLLLTCFVFIFEVILVRNKGIIFFYFFNTLFLFSDNFENSDTRHKRHT